MSGLLGPYAGECAEAVGSFEGMDSGKWIRRKVVIQHQLGFLLPCELINQRVFQIENVRVQVTSVDYGSDEQRPGTLVSCELQLPYESRTSWLRKQSLMRGSSNSKQADLQRTPRFWTM